MDFAILLSCLLNIKEKITVKLYIILNLVCNRNLQAKPVLYHAYISQKLQAQIHNLDSLHLGVTAKRWTEGVKVELPLPAVRYWNPLSA